MGEFRVSLDDIPSPLERTVVTRVGLRDERPGFWRCALVKRQNWT